MVNMNSKSYSNCIHISPNPNNSVTQRAFINCTGVTPYALRPSNQVREYLKNLEEEKIRKFNMNHR